MPKSTHENCLPPRVGISISILVEVKKNLVRAIKIKEANHLVKRYKYDPYLSCIHAIFENIKSSFILHSTTTTPTTKSWGYAPTRPTIMVIT